MIARMPGGRPRRAAFSLGAAVALAATAGCQAMDRHQAKKIPHPGIIDPHQPRELQMVTLPRYVVEPPDELEISVRPTSLELPLTTVTVQADGLIDLGHFGDVYVAGLTLDQVEEKVGQHLQPLADSRRLNVAVDVSVRLLSGAQSKSYYVMGSVTTQGKFPVTGNETVLDAILTAGLRSNSMPEKSYLVRPQPMGAPHQILKIDWEGIRERGETTTNYQIFPGDRIVVPGGRPPGLLGTLLGS